MQCPNCKRETSRVNTECFEDKKTGRVHSFSTCGGCSTAHSERNFPSILVKGKRGRKSKGQDEIFERFSPNTSEQIVMNRNLLKGSPRMVDTDRTRYRDELTAKLRARVAFETNIGGNRNGEILNRYVSNKISSKLGTENWKVVSNDPRSGIITAEKND